MEICFGKNIKFLRNQKNMTQRALGDVLGVENTTIAGWESGSSFPEFKRLVDIRQYFGVELESIVFHDLESNKAVSIHAKTPAGVSAGGDLVRP